MEIQDSNYKKRTQKDYSLSLKLQIVQEIEQGLLTVTGALDKYGVQAASTVRTWLKKYGNFDYQYTIKQKMSKTPEQRILELEQQVKKYKTSSIICSKFFLLYSSVFYFLNSPFQPTTSKVCF